MAIRIYSWLLRICFVSVTGRRAETFWTIRSVTSKCIVRHHVGPVFFMFLQGIADATGPSLTLLLNLKLDCEGTYLEKLNMWTPFGLHTFPLIGTCISPYFPIFVFFQLMLCGCYIYIYWFSSDPITNQCKQKLSADPVCRQHILVVARARLSVTDNRALCGRMITLIGTLFGWQQMTVTLCT